MQAKVLTNPLLKLYHIWVFMYRNITSPLDILACEVFVIEQYDYLLIGFFSISACHGAS